MKHPVLLVPLLLVFPGAEPDAATMVHQFSAPEFRTTAGAPAEQVATRAWCPALGSQALQWASSATNEWLRWHGEAPWSRATHLAVDVWLDSDHGGVFEVGFIARGQPGTALNVSFGLFPRLPARLVFPLSYLDAQEVFLPRAPGRLKGVLWGHRLQPEEIASIALRFRPDPDPQVLWVGDIRLLEGEPEMLPAQGVVVDELGQWAAREWPGKTDGVDALKRRLGADLEVARSSRFPREWSRYGGWTGRRFDATGYFRTHQDGDRWWLVDPEGCAFFSAGLDCVRTMVETPVLPGTESWFAWRPDPGGTFAQAVGRNRGVATIDFSRANLIRAFGADWDEKWRELSLGRLKAWRFNTIANWSDLDRLRPVDVPYVFQLNGFPSTRVMLFRDFPDVFSEEYRQASIRFAQGLAGVRDDPWLIGYFLRNEPIWAFGRNNLAAEMLEANPGSATRRELARWLQSRYQGDVERWSAAWGREFDSFGEVVQGIHRRAADASPKAAADLWEFSREMVRAYVGIPCDEVRRVDPHHLNLGMRYASISSDLLYDAGERFDVFSINCYRMIPDFDAVETITRRTGKPVMIGEFHFGALDRGLPSTGLRGVVSQAERGVAYRRYVEQAASHPALVGVHYFTLADQAVLGRFDGENYQIGFVDICHRPYEETVEQARLAHENIYAVRSGQRQPFNQAALERPPVK